MGMLLFLVASGLTLIFGLMDVLNFAHGALFSWGAFAGFSIAVVLLDRRFGWASAPVGRRQPAGLLARGPGGRRAGRRPRSASLLERVIVRPGLRPAPLPDPDHPRRHHRAGGADPHRVGAERPGDAGAGHASGLVGRGRRGGPALPGRRRSALGLLVYAGMQLVLHPDPRGSHRAGRRRERRDGPGDGPRPAPLFHRGVRRRLRRSRGWAALMWAMFSQSVRPAMGGEQLDLRLHRGDHRRARQRHRLARRRAPGRASPTTTSPSSSPRRPSA